MLNVPIKRELNPARSRVLHVRSAAGMWRARGVTFLALALTWFAAGAVAFSESGAKGRVEGAVFVGDPGKKSYVTGATVRISGPVTIETTTSADGKYAFAELLPGIYEIVADFPGLSAVQTITVDADQSVSVPLQLTPLEVKTSVTVTAQDPSAKLADPPGTINEKTVQDAPNPDQRWESLLPLVPGVVRGPDGHINMKGARPSQNGALVNSANVTDPATGSPAINLPIDVVSSVQVISNPYDPQYGKMTGAVSNVETKTGNYERYHFSIQNVAPRLRERGGHIVGIGAATPRMTITGPLVKDRVAFTQSFEYRFVRTPVNSLPPLQRDTTLQGYNSYTQFDSTISPKQTATLSLVMYPQSLNYLGLNTFTPQPSTGDFHQHGYQLDLQHRYLTGTESTLISQLTYKRYNADVGAQSDDQYQLLIDTTEGGFFNRQARWTSRYEWQETYQFAPRQFLGTHRLKAGADYAYSSYHAHETFLPVEIIGSSGATIERISFTPPTRFGVDQNETAWFMGDQWNPFQRLTVTLGLRFDNDSVTGSTHAAPRAGLSLELTGDGKTLLKAGAGVFYGRVPLALPVFGQLPDRTVEILGDNGQVVSSVFYPNQIVGGLHNPRSTAWNVALERQVSEHLLLRVGYEERNTAKDFIVSPVTQGSSSLMALSNGGSESYRELQVTGRYQIPRLTLNGSYVRSRAYGDLNDFALFFGNYPQAVIQPDARARLAVDAPNRFVFWADMAGPLKLTLVPVCDVHTGFPYSAEDEFREYVGPPNSRRFPGFSSFDLQVTRPVSLPFDGRRIKARVGFGVYNVFNHFDPRDVQNVVASSEFGLFFNNNWRNYSGKFVFQF